MSNRTVIVSAARTPFGKLGGSLSSYSAVQLGGRVIEDVVRRAGIQAKSLDKVIMGMVLQAGAGQVPARQAARYGGLPWEVSAETINKVCASGLRAVTLGDQIIRSGDASLIVAGGMESMSNAPYALPRMRFGNRIGHGVTLDLMLHDGLTCPFEGVHMIVHGNRVTSPLEISRQEQDEWALRSHQRAIEARLQGKLQEQITAVRVERDAQHIDVVEADEAPREYATIEALTTLTPVFEKEGTITAGNAPGINDGAGAMVIMSASKAKPLGIEPMATIIHHAEVGAEAPCIARTPMLAIQKLLAQSSYKIDDIDLFEINEAFATVVLTTIKLLELDARKVNVNGGAIAFGHPIGASGARILMSLIYELRRRGGGLGIAAICSGTAQGDAILVKVE